MGMAFGFASLVVRKYKEDLDPAFYLKSVSRKNVIALSYF